MTHEKTQSLERENDDLKPPSEEGGAPRPATEPKSGEGSARNAETKTDPASGEPTR